MSVPDHNANLHYVVGAARQISGVARVPVATSRIMEPAPGSENPAYQHLQKLKEKVRLLEEDNAICLQTCQDQEHALDIDQVEMPEMMRNRLSSQRQEEQPNLDQQPDNLDISRDQLDNNLDQPTGVRSKLSTTTNNLQASPLRQDLLDLDLIDVDGLEGDEDNWLTGPENKEKEEEDCLEWLRSDMEKNKDSLLEGRIFHKISFNSSFNSSALSGCSRNSSKIGSPETTSTPSKPFRGCDSRSITGPGDTGTFRISRNTGYHRLAYNGGVEELNRTIEFGEERKPGGLNTTFPHVGNQISDPTTSTRTPPLLGGGIPANLNDRVAALGGLGGMGLMAVPAESTPMPEKTRRLSNVNTATMTRPRGMKTVIRTNDFAANMEDVIAANTPEIDSVDSLGTPDLSLVSANTPDLSLVGIEPGELDLDEPLTLQDLSITNSAQQCRDRDVCDTTFDKELAGNRTYDQDDSQGNRTYDQEPKTLGEAPNLKPQRPSQEMANRTYDSSPPQLHQNNRTFEQPPDNNRTYEHPAGGNNTFNQPSPNNRTFDGQPQSHLAANRTFEQPGNRTFDGQNRTFDNKSRSPPNSNRTFDGANRTFDSSQLPGNRTYDGNSPPSVVNRTFDGGQTTVGGNRTFDGNNRTFDGNNSGGNRTFDGPGNRKMSEDRNSSGNSSQHMSRESSNDGLLEDMDVLSGEMDRLSTASGLSESSTSHRLNDVQDVQDIARIQEESLRNPQSYQLRSATLSPNSEASLSSPQTEDVGGGYQSEESCNSESGGTLTARPARNNKAVNPAYIHNNRKYSNRGPTSCYSSEDSLPDSPYSSQSLDTRTYPDPDTCRSMPNLNRFGGRPTNRSQPKPGIGQGYGLGGNQQHSSEGRLQQPRLQYPGNRIRPPGVSSSTTALTQHHTTLHQNPQPTNNLQQQKQQHSQLQQPSSTGSGEHQFTKPAQPLRKFSGIARPSGPSRIAAPTAGSGRVSVSGPGAAPAAASTRLPAPGSRLRAPSRDRERRAGSVSRLPGAPGGIQQSYQNRNQY